MLKHISTRVHIVLMRINEYREAFVKYTPLEWLSIQGTSQPNQRPSSNLSLQHFPYKNEMTHYTEFCDSFSSELDMDDVTWTLYHSMVGLPSPTKKMSTSYFLELGNMFLSRVKVTLQVWLIKDLEKGDYLQLSGWLYTTNII